MLAEPIEPLSPLSPLSPVSEAIRRQVFAQPPVAVVHQPSFGSFERSSSESSLTRNPKAYPARLEPIKTAGQLVVEIPRASDRIVTRRPLVKDEKTRTISIGVEDELRSLSKQEVRQRSKDATKHFKEMTSINRRARTIEDVDMTMAKVRQMKAELEEADPLRHTPKVEKKIILKELPKAKVKEVPAETPPEPEPADEAPAEEPKKLSLAERMGYGVKSKEDNSKWSKLKAAVQATSAVNALKKGGGTFRDIKAGNNDLKARLAAKKAEVEAEMAGFERMDLAIPEFIQTFRTNPNLVTKISQTTGIPTTELKSLDDVELQRWFKEMDTDGSGTLDFKEFVEGILKLQEKKENPKAGATPKARAMKRRSTIA